MTSFVSNPSGFPRQIKEGNGISISESIGDISFTYTGTVHNVIAGNGLTGTITSGIATLGVNYDGSTIRLNNDGQLEAVYPAIATLFFHEETGTFGYKSLLDTPADDPESVATGTANNSTVLMEQWATEAINTTLIPGGTWHNVIFAATSSTAAGTNSFVDYYLYRRTSGGTETLIYSGTVGPLSTTPTEYESDKVLPDIISNTTDIIITRIYARVNGPAARIVSFYYEGTLRYSHIHTPLALSSTAGGDISGNGIAGQLAYFTANKIIASNPPSAFGLISGSGTTGFLAEWNNNSLQTSNVKGTGGQPFTLNATLIGGVTLLQHIPSVSLFSTGPAPNSMVLNFAAGGSQSVTLPASGIVAMLGTANIFTANNYFSGTVHIKDRLGIGTANATNALEVVGGVYITGSGLRINSNYPVPFSVIQNTGTFALGTAAFLADRDVAVFGGISGSNTVIHLYSNNDMAYAFTRPGFRNVSSVTYSPGSHRLGFTLSGTSIGYFDQNSFNVVRDMTVSQGLNVGSATGSAVGQIISQNGGFAPITYIRTGTHAGTIQVGVTSGQFNGSVRATFIRSLENDLDLHLAAGINGEVWLGGGTQAHLVINASGTASILQGLNVGGNLNVGLTTGYGKLHASQNISETSALSISSTAVAKISNPNNTTNNSTLLKFSGPDNDTSVLLGSKLVNAGNGDSAFILGVRNSGGVLSEFLRVTSAGHVLPGSAGTQNFGDASLYWNDISYKTLTDRGCLFDTSAGVELEDGSSVSCLDVITHKVKKHSHKKSIQGRDALDYSQMPKDVYKPAPIADKDIYEGGKLKYKKGDKMGEDGAEMSALISILLGATRELQAEINALKAQIATGKA